MTSARLELTWPGKDKFLLVPKDENGKPVWVERDHPAASEVRLETLAKVSPGSRIRKAPRDLLTSGAVRTRRRSEREAAERHTEVVGAEGSSS